MASCPALVNAPPRPTHPEDARSASVRTRSSRTLIGTLLVYVVLVATHRGEFWPFSIYPMFSLAGRPWARTVVRELPPGVTLDDWRPRPLEDLPGRPFPLRPAGIDAIDLSNYVRKTEHWNADVARGLERMFHDQLEEHRLLVVRVDGRLEEGSSVVVSATPVALMDRDGVTLDPALEAAPEAEEARR